MAVAVVPMQRYRLSTTEYSNMIEAGILMKYTYPS